MGGVCDGAEAELPGGREVSVRLVALALAAFATPVVAQVPPTPTVVPARPAMTFDARTVPDRQAVLDVLDYTTAAQIKALTDERLTLGYGAIKQPTAGWVASAFYTGATRLVRVSDRSGADAFLRSVAEHYNYAFRGAFDPKDMIDADDQAIGELYQEMYARHGQAGMLMPLAQRLDYTLPYLEMTPAPRRLTWWWCDALFMAPPVLARMSVLTGDPKYLRAMDVQWWRLHDRLWSADESLYYRDERFLDRKSETGAKIFWSRGNGWVAGGYARVLESMPADFPSRARYIATFKTMMARIAKLQAKDGLWPTSLLDPAGIPGPETSGSAFYTYAMAWGINHGILDRKTFLPHVLRGWAALAGQIQPNGLLGHVQRTGDQPVPSTAADTGLYGTGGLILAGLEVMRLGQPVTALPLAEPKRESPRERVAPPAPPPGTPAEEKERARRRAETAAADALGYDPAKRE